MSHAQPFAVHILREQANQKILTVRFEVLDGGNDGLRDRLAALQFA